MQAALNGPVFEILKFQYEVPKKEVSVPELVKMTILKKPKINFLYGKLGKTLAVLLTKKPYEEFKKGWPYLSYGAWKEGIFYWTLHKNLRIALEALEIFAEDDMTPEFLLTLEDLKSTQKLTDTRLKMLGVHYNSPNFDLTATELALHMGWEDKITANGNYGKLGAFFENYLGPCSVCYDDGKPMNVAHLVTFWNDGEEWHWIMRRGLRKALEILEIVKPKNEVSNPEKDQVMITDQSVKKVEIEYANDINEPELLGSGKQFEGAKTTKIVNAYERNPKARQKCLEIKGTICHACKIPLTDIYGPIAEGFIHVHHIKPLSEIGEKYEVNAETDLVPVCPNCHAMLHLGKTTRTIDELREIIKQIKKQKKAPPKRSSLSLSYKPVYELICGLGCFAWVHFNDTCCAHASANAHGNQRFTATTTTKFINGAGG